MNKDDLTSGAIMRCPEYMSQAALELVFETLPAELRAAHVASLLAACKSEPLDGLLVRLAPERVDAALFVESQPGRVATFWGPSLRPSCLANRNQIATALIEAGRDWAQRNGIELAQTLLVEEKIELSSLYRDAGFAIRTELDYLVSHVQDVSPIENDSDLCFAPYAAAESDLLAGLIARTYDGTCDCPELNGVRDMQGVIEGYADAGDSHDRHWYFARSGENIVGVLLMAEHTAQNQAELVYMGVVPEFRGRGYGLALAEFAQKKTRRLGHSRLILAVDTRNKPALELYTRAGFCHCDRRIAMLHPLLNVSR